MNDHDWAPIEAAMGTPAEAEGLRELDEFEAGDEFDDLDEGQSGPWFLAGFDSEAACCQAGVMEGETIRADGDGGWAHRECVERDQDRDVIDLSGPMLGW